MTIQLQKCKPLLFCLVIINPESTFQQFVPNRRMGSWGSYLTAKDPRVSANQFWNIQKWQ